MSWVELQLVVVGDAAEAIGAGLIEAGAIGCQEDYLPGEQPLPQQPWDTGPPPQKPERALLRVWWNAGDRGVAERAVAWAKRTFDGVESLCWVAVDDQGWGDAWRASAVRIQIIDGSYVSPPWLAEPGDLIIEPGMAFGTGDHPTTLSCLRAVLKYGNGGKTCLDVGTGSGILAIAAARLGMAAWGVDIDPESARAALDNARLNQVQIQADLTPLERVDGRFDLVVANVFAEVLVVLAEDLKRVTSGHLAVAGVLADRADTVVTALAPMRLVSREEEGDWCHMGFGW